MTSRPQKKRDEQADLAQTVLSWLTMVRMGESIDKKLTRRLSRLLDKGLCRAQTDHEWCRFMLYVVAQLLSIGFANSGHYRGDEYNLLMDFLLVRVAQEKLEPFATEFQDRFDDGNC